MSDLLRPGVAVLTDSTASLPPGQPDQTEIEIIALQVVLDGVSSPEGESGVTGSDVAAALGAGKTVTTSRPHPEAFAHAYRKVADRGARAAVSVHLSGAISSTYDAALRAASTAPIPVTVVDSRTLAMALGFAAVRGAEAAATGASIAEVSDVIRRQANASVAYFSVDSLEYLRRGGRIGTAQALIGSALAVKPLLTVTDGVVRPYERVRTRTKAVARLEELAVSACVSADDGGPSVRLAVHHLDDPDAGHELGDRLGHRLRELGIDPQIVVTEVSAVLGVHVGPGTLGVVVAPMVGLP